jgi:8-amino-7-oxononanoate synthase
MDSIKNILMELEQLGLKRQLRDVIPISARELLIDNKKYINFSSNNYLDLSVHPKVIERSIDWTEKYGVGSGASRLVTGTLRVYTELEEQIAQWKGSEAALLFSSGYLANLGVVATLANRKTVIFADKLNHASLNAGTQLSGAKFVRYRHNDLEHLKILLDKYSDFKHKIIVSDTVFSMNGDIADIAALQKIAKERDVPLYLDDAHATGVFGENGSGLTHGVDASLTMGTFSKGMGSYGAYLSSTKEMKEFLINKCSSFIYTTALPPGVCGAISAAVELVQSAEFKEKRKILQDRHVYLRKELKCLGFNTGDSSTQIIPIILEDAKLTVNVSKYLLNSGILAVAIRPPTVPKNGAMLRVSLSSAHTKSDLEYLLEKLNEVKKNEL